MSPTATISAACVVAFAGLAVLTHPIETIEFSRKCQAWLNGDVIPQNPAVHTASERFDAAVQEITAISEIPRPKIARAPIMPHVMVSRKAKEQRNWSRQLASARVRTASPRPTSYSPRPNGIYARSKVGGSGKYRSRSSATSLFEQSRFYQQNGSAFERINSRVPHRR